MTEEVKQYLWTEFKFNNLPKYYKYFDAWIENLTENQILYYDLAAGKPTSLDVG